MRNLSGLVLKIKGQYNDAFLYGNKLYLVNDETVAIYGFDKLIDALSPEDSDKRILMKYAFLHNEFFYKADSVFYDFFNLSQIRSFLQSSFDDLRIKTVSPTNLKKSLFTQYFHHNPGCIHFEVYKSNIFMSGEKGTQAFKNIEHDLKRNLPIFEFPALHISAVVGDALYFSCGHNGFIIVEFSNLRDASRKIEKMAINTNEDLKAISTENAYCDIIIRNLNNHYLYEANTNWNTGSQFRDISPDQRVLSFKPIRDQGFLVDADFVSSSGNRLLVFSNGDINLHKMKYDERQEDYSDKELHYEQIDTWQNILGIDGGEIYSGYQTVFGLILDTDEGTIVLDDYAEGGSDLKKRIISKGENVKVRHFYRAINYSHIVISIKNNEIEIFTDLTDYFFPKKNKRIRRKISKNFARAL